MMKVRNVGRPCGVQNILVDSLDVTTSEGGVKTLEVKGSREDELGDLGVQTYSFCAEHPAYETSLLISVGGEFVSLQRLLEWFDGRPGVVASCVEATGHPTRGKTKVARFDDPTTDPSLTELWPDHCRPV